MLGWLKRLFWKPPLVRYMILYLDGLVEGGVVGYTLVDDRQTALAILWDQRKWFPQPMMDLEQRTLQEHGRVYLSHHFHAVVLPINITRIMRGVSLAVPMSPIITNNAKSLVWLSGQGNVAVRDHVRV